MNLLESKRTSIAFLSLFHSLTRALACLSLFSLRKRVNVSLPEWLYDYETSLENAEFSTDEEMMDVAIEISARNVKEATGGPFGCAIFEKDPDTNKAKLVAVGANRVVPLCNSTIHGEMAAIQFAEKKLQSFSLRPSNTNKQYIMCTSCEPCAMCLGGTFWAAPAEMICAATKDDAEAIGFNEGPVCKYRVNDAFVVESIFWSIIGKLVDLH